MLLWVVFTAVLLLGVLFRYRIYFQEVRLALTRWKKRRDFLRYMQTNYSILDRFLDVVKTHPNKPFVLFKDESFTYRDADLLSNKAAAAFLRSDVTQDDTVALFLSNQPGFLWLWLGLAKIGCSAAFLNSNIRSKSLLHCFSRSGAKVLVADEELQDAVEEVLPSLLEQQVTVFIFAEKCKIAGLKSFKERMNEASSEPLSKELRSHVTLHSPAVYIYTSGTTGLPKAALVTHGKLWQQLFLFNVCGVKSSDVVYNSLPLYHSAGFLGFTGTIDRGSTIALRTKFSTSQFWDDCRRYDATVIQYIGEIMRYLCNTPQKPNDRSHKVRLALGNGIRADVWKEFVRRFGNIKIIEFYGATEGNFSLINTNNKVGSIGRDTFMLRKLYLFALIRYDVDSGEPVRNSSGLCMKVAKGEPGLLVTHISLKTPFLGYTKDLTQTEKKKLHDVLQKGDLFFNTGDVMRIDKDGYFYFHDRLGDTFRWKGENVATTEVADVVMLAHCIQEANVYGVEVPGHEGRVGMAAVTLRDGHKFDSAEVFRQVKDFLPAYARPVFIRVQSSLEVTGTYKHLKAKLVEEGFQLHQITEPLYFLTEAEKSYVPLTVDSYDSIMAGTVKM